MSKSFRIGPMCCERAIASKIPRLVPTNDEMRSESRLIQSARDTLHEIGRTGMGAVTNEYDTALVPRLAQGLVSEKTESQCLGCTRKQLR